MLQTKYKWKHTMAYAQNYALLCQWQHSGDISTRIRIDHCQHFSKWWSAPRGRSTTRPSTRPVSKLKRHIKMYFTHNQHSKSYHLRNNNFFRVFFSILNNNNFVFYVICSQNREKLTYSDDQNTSGKLIHASFECRQFRSHSFESSTARHPYVQSIDFNEVRWASASK